MKRTLFLIVCMSAFSLSAMERGGHQFSGQEKDSLSPTQYREALNQLLDTTSPRYAENDNKGGAFAAKISKRSASSEIIEATATTVVGLIAMLYFGCNFDGTCSNTSLCSWLSSFFG